MKRVNVTQFKARCFGLIDEVAKSKEPLEVTNRGEAVAVLYPAEEKVIDWTPGDCAHTVTFVGDVVSPAVDEADWNVERNWL